MCFLGSHRRRTRREIGVASSADLCQASGKRIWDSCGMWVRLWIACPVCGPSIKIFLQYIGLLAANYGASNGKENGE